LVRTVAFQAADIVQIGHRCCNWGRIEVGGKPIAARGIRGGIAMLGEVLDSFKIAG